MRPLLAFCVSNSLENLDCHSERTGPRTFFSSGVVSEESAFGFLRSQRRTSGSRQSRRGLRLTGLFIIQTSTKRANPPSVWSHRMTFDIQEILGFLPHRYPFLLIDRVVEFERTKGIVALKNVTINEPHFQGHFPGQPIMPGVLVIESMAQTGGLLLLTEVPDREKKLLYFVAVDGARFRRPVVPGDQLKVEMNVLSWRGDFCKLEGRATVEGQLAAEATLMCKMVDREAVTKPQESAK